MNKICWLDKEDANGECSLFKAIASGISQAEVIIVFISDEYANSDTCIKELTFASITCKKHIVPVVVGEGMNWRFTECGLILTEKVYIDFRDPSRFNLNMDMLIGRLQKILN